MANAPTSVEIRTYQVGFGDCFLLSFIYSASKKRHVLVDFGTTGLPDDAPRSRMMDIAEDIKARCEGKLHAVVATHRHRDHISGFETKPNGKGTGDVIASLKPDVVIQPWTEDPELETDATGPQLRALDSRTRRVSALSAMHAVAAQAINTAKRRRYIPKALREQLSFLGEDNLKNLSAVKNLMNMAPNNYVHFGTASGLARILPGVKVHVLGPPTLDDDDKIKVQRRTDPGEFWHFQMNALRFAEGQAPKKPVLFPRHVASAGPSFPIDARWLVYHARLVHSSQLLQLVRILDSAMNNTSVILLFEIGDKLLLFPGDAQIENWSFALSKENVRELLKKVNLYKVGHHGSLNATPKTLWNLFDNKSTSEDGQDRLVSLMSTMEGKHGSEANETEVPRRPLVHALAAETDHFSTQELHGDTFFHDETIEV